MSQVSLDRVPYTLGSAAGSRASIMLTHFDGAIDAGFAGRIAVDHLLRALPAERVVTFSSDALIDYRSHRPVLTVERWMTSSMDCPQIAIDLVHDDAGTPVWILHGPEPDLRWEGLAGTVVDLAREAGVELAVSLHGIPSSVPHTRPVQVHAHATTEDLLPEQPELPGPMHMQASVSAFLQYRLHQSGVQGMALLPTVPYYVGDSPYPPGATAMLSHLSTVAGLALPLGELEQGAQSDREAIDALVEKNPEIAAMIGQLEQAFDDLESQGKLPHLASAWDEAAASLGDLSGTDLVDSVEAFLENIARREATQPPLASDKDTSTDTSSDTSSGAERPNDQGEGDQSIGAQHASNEAAADEAAADEAAGGAVSGGEPTAAGNIAHTADHPVSDQPHEAHGSTDTIEAVLRRIAEREQRRQAGLPPVAYGPLRRRDNGHDASNDSDHPSDHNDGQASCD